MKSLKWKICLIITCLSTLAFSVYGGQPGAFLNFGASARSIGMGRAFVGLADDSSAIQTNPAGIVQVATLEGSLFQTDLYNAYTLTAFNMVLPMIDNHLGFSFIQLKSADMELRNAYNEVEGTFSDAKTAYTVSYAQPLFIPNLSLGFSGKYVTRKLHTHEDQRILGDVGTIFRPFKFLSIGATIHNLLDFSLDQNSADEFVPVIRGGVAYKDKNFTVLYDVERDLDSWFLGIEYKFNPMFSIRGGINYESTNFGFSSELVGMRFDYAFSTDQLGDNHRFSFNIGVGQMIQGLQQDSAVDWYELGVEKYQEGFFLMALEDMKKAYILHPHDEKIQRRLQKLKKLEQIGDKLNLDINIEKRIWPQYKRAKVMIEAGEIEAAKQMVTDLLKKYPANPNLLKLLDEINPKENT